MPDLETGIQQWKRSLTIVFGGYGEIVDELESHLREEIDRLIQAGETPDAALTAAETKLGRPMDLAAEYARTERAAVWLPIAISLPFFLLLIGLKFWTTVIRQLPRLTGFAKIVDNSYESIVACLLLATRSAGDSIILYTGLLALGYFLCWRFRPIKLGQLRSLRRTLLMANALAAIFLLTDLVGFRVFAYMEMGHLPGMSTIVTFFVRVVPALWCLMLAALLWAVPKKLHLWALLSVSTITISFWANLLPDIRFGFSYSADQLCVMTLITAIPVSALILGLLPAGRLVRRAA
jgi:hypothetical protein